MFMQRTASWFAVCGALAAASLYSVSLSSISTADITGTIQSTSNFAHWAVARGYEVAPALMLGLVLLTAVPLIAVASPVVYYVTRPEAATRRFRPGAGDAIAAEFSGERARNPARAYLEVVGFENRRITIVRDMLRIGREDDNDIRFSNKGVHRYHAAIYRENFDDWFVADLSGVTGNGVRVNGKLCVDSQLKDGDIIQLGPGRLRFCAGT